MGCVVALLPPIAVLEAGDRGGLVGLKDYGASRGRRGVADVTARLLRVAPLLPDG